MKIDGYEKMKAKIGSKKKHDKPAIEEAKKPMVKVKLKDPSQIKVKVTDIGPGGKEYVRKNEMDEGAAWTKKSGKNKEGGLNEKGRKS